MLLMIWYLRFWYCFILYTTPVIFSLKMDKCLLKLSISWCHYERKGLWEYWIFHPYLQNYGRNNNQNWFFSVSDLIDSFNKNNDGFLQLLMDILCVLFYGIIVQKYDPGYILSSLNLVLLVKSITPPHSVKNIIVWIELVEEKYNPS